MELLVAGTPGSWFPKAMETFRVLVFYFLLKGRMKFKPASGSRYQQHGLLKALSVVFPPVLSTSAFHGLLPHPLFSSSWL